MKTYWFTWKDALNIHFCDGFDAMSKDQAYGKIYAHCPDAWNVKLEDED